MLTIRLTRKGKKNQPFFRVVLVDKRRSSTGGRAVEDLGYVDPLKKRRSLKAERIKYWISKGAKASATVHNFLVTEKIIDAKKIVKKSKKPAVSAAPVAVAPAAATPEPEAKKEEAPVEPAPVEDQKDLPAPAEELKLPEATVEAKPEEKLAE
ncbi:MAG: 30S ribosomal protein S16 [Candidatus Staskawiczbacteria bacterium]|nr:30S ribosomal protein S16 [Candidatus Staskawiczbacteria bacterium]